ncbi:MAG: hypothetical protein PHH01_05185 [Patescibacteria group bacterium]|nr:hypothetical protein [Patescibacteria group bacterium]MDD5567560.1 hypothetical protein [Patescibacteria group bacterium]
MNVRDTLVNLLTKRVDDYYVMKFPRRFFCPLCGSQTFGQQLCRRCLNQQARQYFSQKK